MAELGPGPGVRESRGGEEEEGLEVAVLAAEWVCAAEERRAASAVGAEPGPAASRACRVEGAPGWSWTRIGHPGPLSFAPHMSLLSPQLQMLHASFGSPQTAPTLQCPPALLPQAKLLPPCPCQDQEDAWHELASPIPTAISFLAFFFPCLPLLFLLLFFSVWGFCRHQQRRRKKKLITEKSYVLCWQIAQGALSALIRLCWGAAARCCPQPPAGS